MIRFHHFLRGLLLAGAIALISVPSAAQAGGGKGFCGNFGVGFCGGGCYPSFCYRPSFCYQPLYLSCYQPCYTTTYPLVTVGYPTVVQPWQFNCVRPCVKPICGPIVIKCH